MIKSFLDRLRTAVRPESPNRREWDGTLPPIWAEDMPPYPGFGNASNLAQAIDEDGTWGWYSHTARCPFCHTLNIISRDRYRCGECGGHLGYRGR